MRAKFLTAFAASALIALGAASTAGAGTVGQTAVPAGTCALNFERAIPAVVSGNSYVVPSTGGVASWTLTSCSYQAMVVLESIL